MEKTTKTNTVFKTLSAIDCRDKTEKKNGLTTEATRSGDLRATNFQNLV